MELNLQFDNKAVVRDHISFGHLPIMLRVRIHFYSNFLLVHSCLLFDTGLSDHLA